MCCCFQPETSYVKYRCKPLSIYFFCVYFNILVDVFLAMQTDTVIISLHEKFRLFVIVWCSERRTCFFILYHIQFLILIPVFCAIQDIYSFTHSIDTCESVFHREYQNILPFVFNVESSKFPYRQKSCILTDWKSCF